MPRHVVPVSLPNRPSEVCYGHGTCATVAGWDGSDVEAPGAPATMSTATMACSILLCGGVVTDDGDGDGISDALYGGSGALATMSALTIPHPLLAPPC